jgi:hypothetical protein
VTEKLLRLVGPIHIVAGLLVFTIGFLPAAQVMLVPYFSAADQTIWSAFFFSVLGPTIASWGVLFTALVAQFFAAPSIAVWRALLFSVLIWAPLDTALCLKYGILIGVVINSAVVIGLVWLLLSVRKFATK